MAGLKKTESVDVVRRGGLEHPHNPRGAPVMRIQMKTNGGVNEEWICLLPPPPPPRSPRNPSAKSEPSAVEACIDRSPQGLAPSRVFCLERPMLVNAPLGPLDTESLSSLDPATRTENKPRISISSSVYAASDAPSQPQSLYDDPGTCSSFIDLF